MYIFILYSIACTYTKLVRASLSVLLSVYGVSLLLGTGSGVISFGSCFMVDRNFSVVVVDGLWLYPEILIDAWLPIWKINLVNMQIFQS